MVKEVEVIKKTEEEIIEGSVNSFIEWYLKGADVDVLGSASRRKIMDFAFNSLVLSEFGELSFVEVLKEKGYELFFSNIHFRNDRRPATSIDLIFKKDGLHFIAEAKTLINEKSKQTLIHVNKNLKDANNDIKGRFSNLDFNINKLLLPNDLLDEITSSKDNNLIEGIALVLGYCPIQIVNGVNIGLHSVEFYSNYVEVTTGTVPKMLPDKFRKQFNPKKKKWL